MFYYGLDMTYIVMVMPFVLLAMLASARVNSIFEKYSHQKSQRRITGAEAARRVLDANGLQHVRIEHIPGSLTDHFDPTEDVVRLSDSVYGDTSTAAIGVACHEVGHAIQHSVGYLPVRVRMAIIPATNIGSKLSIPLIILGLLLASASPQLLMLAYIGVALFGLSALFQLVTLPCEFNASHRALQSLEQFGILTDEELRGSRKVLWAAAMTYVAALAVTLMQLLRFVLLVASRDRD
ncbi:MAG: zinc metallopeptidase [Clostridia bacterium]|nr:zinc metallopeptidase [Clostridia bacterium]